jgi:hypothetical protein
MSKNSENPKVASSPERNTFQLEGARKRAAEDGKEVPEFYENFWKTAKQQDEENLVDPEWQKDNMEYDLRSTEWICDKVKAYDNYAQNLYAAMCNMQFIKLAVIPILKDQRWSASWRHSGGIVADMQEKGDYIEWYCSGIGNEEYGNGLDGTKPKLDEDGREYVPEGVVTEEIRADLQKLGWIPVPWDDDDS